MKIVVQMRPSSVQSQSSPCFSNSSKEGFRKRAVPIAGTINPFRILSHGGLFDYCLAETTGDNQSWVDS